MAGFLAAMAILQVSQVVLYPPGVDVSPYAFATGQLHANSVAGISVQTWAFGLLALVCLIGLIARRGRTGIRGAPIVWGALGLLLVVPAFTTNSVGAYLDGMGKLVLPVVVYLYLSRPDPSPPRPLMQLMLAVNLFTVGQVLVCFVATGSFSAHIYYHELTREYFGFYHHPFAMAGVLGICAIAAVHQLTNRVHVWPNAILLVCDLVLIYLSQVRTYTVAVAVGLGAALILLLIRAGRRRLALIIVGVAAIAGGAIVGLQGLASGRVTADPTSGRFDRWITDLSGFTSTASPVQLIFGGGAQYVLDLNARLIDLRINSLNLLVDNFINLGVVGSLAFLLAWAVVLVDAFRRRDGIFVLALALFVLIAALLSNVFDFPITTTLFATALVAVVPPSEVRS